MCGWFNRQGDTVNGTQILCLGVDGLASDGLTFIPGTGIAGVSDNIYATSHTDMITGRWYFIGLTHNGSSTWTMYVDGVNEGTMPDTVTSHSELWVGNFGADGQLNGRAAHIKCWNTQLTGDQMRDEMWSARPVHALNSLNFYWPLWSAADTNDYGPNGRNPTVGGTLTTEDGPPVANRRVRMGRYYKPAAVAATKAPPPYRQAARYYTKRRAS